MAKKGYRVVGIDTDLDKVKIVQEGRAPFFEPKLEAYLQETISRNTFTATTDFQTSSESDATFITVGTPGASSDDIDLKPLESACMNICRSLRDRPGYRVLIVKSTVIPGTTRNLVKPLIERLSGKISGKDFGLCANPEFLREGHAIDDSENPDRIIIGSEDPPAAEKLALFYREFTPNVPPERMILTTPENAELIKYANNAFLATKLSFINTIASLAERIPGADVATVAKGIGLDARIGSQFLNAGLGWGGSCLPKDLKAVDAFCKRLGCDSILIRAVIEVNRKQPSKAAEFAKQALVSLSGKRIAVLGLAFKPNTDDMREAVSVSIVNELLAEGAEVTAYDPAADQKAKEVFDDRIHLASNAKACLKDADLAIIVTEWEEFMKLKPEDFPALMKTPLVFDGRRIYDPDKMRAAGVMFGAVGLGPKTGISR